MSRFGLVKTGAGLALAVVIAAGMARGIHHPAPPAAARTIAHAGPAAGSGSSGGVINGATAYRILALLVVAGVVAFGLHLYHRRKQRSLYLEIAQLDGWEAVPLAELRRPHKCPGCMAWISLGDVAYHQEHTQCAAFERWRERTGGEESESQRVQDVPWAVRESASNPPERSVIVGGYDDITEE